MRDAKFFLEIAASIYRKNIINSFSKILDENNCNGDKNYDLYHASIAILKGLTSGKNQKILTSSNKQKCKYNNSIPSEFWTPIQTSTTSSSTPSPTPSPTPPQKTHETHTQRYNYIKEKLEDIDWYLVDRKFYNIKNPTEEDKASKNDTLCNDKKPIEQQKKFVIFSSIKMITLMVYLWNI